MIQQTLHVPTGANLAYQVIILWYFCFDNLFAQLMFISLYCIGFIVSFLDNSASLTRIGLVVSPDVEVKSQSSASESPCLHASSIFQRNVARKCHGFIGDKGFVNVLSIVPI